MKTVQERLNAIQKELNEIQEIVSSKDTSEIIRVPDRIHIERTSGDEDSDELGIHSTDGEYRMSVEEGRIHIDGAYEDDIIPCQLIKIDESEIVSGGTYYRTKEDDILFSISELGQYCKCDDKNNLWYFNYLNEVLKLSYTNDFYWYKVVPLNT